MKNQTFALFVIAVFGLLSACTQSKKMTGASQSTTLWINSTYQDTVSYGTGISGLYHVICFGVRNSDSKTDEKLTKKEFGYIPDVDWEPLCGLIKGFEYEEGYLYKVKVQQTKSTIHDEPERVEITEWKLLKVLSKEKDTHFQKKETIAAWVGPKMIKVQCGSPMAPPSCREMRHQVQYGGLDKSGEWQPLYDIYTIPDYEEGYIYQIKYTKVYLSDFEISMIADHVGFESENVQVLSKTKY